MTDKDISKLRVLVIDDEQANVELLKEILDMVGCENAKTCMNAMEAVEIYAENEFDLILLDVNMPGKNGIELMREFSNIKKDISPKIIILTGHHGKEVREEAMACGALSVITKPFYPMEIVELLENLDK